MSMIDITNLTFAYEGSYDNIFENVSFRIDTDWKLGFTGRNGRGKTTFLNLLLGKYEYTGNISASTCFEYFPYEVKDASVNTIELAEILYPDFIQWKLVRELFLLQLGEDILYRPFETLSKGEQTKVMLAILFLKENNFLLIDEPTNHLDLHGREVVMDYLNSKKGFILVSHDRAFLDGCVDHILSINRSDISIEKGNFSSWFMNKARQDNFELAENEKLKREIRHLEQASKRAESWSDKVEKTKFGTKNSGIKPDKGYIGHKSAKMMQRSKSIEDRQMAAVDSKSRLLKNIEAMDSLKISQLDYHSSCLLSLDQVSINYGDNLVCQDVSLCVDKGDRIAVCGKNGSGKSSILKLICGDNISYSGNFEKGSRLIISYVSQDTGGLLGNLSDYALSYNIDESLFKAILRKLDFSRLHFEKDMSSFSAGQKKKVLLARSLCEKAHLHIWDEPLNYIDVYSRMQIENLLLEFSPTILFVEHDRRFCEKISNKEVEL